MLGIKQWTKQTEIKVTLFPLLQFTHTHTHTHNIFIWIVGLLIFIPFLVHPYFLIILQQILISLLIWKILLKNWILTIKHWAQRPGRRKARESKGHLGSVPLNHGGGDKGNPVTSYPPVSPVILWGLSWQTWGSPRQRWSWEQKWHPLTQSFLS